MIGSLNHKNSVPSGSVIHLKSMTNGNDLQTPVSGSQTLSSLMKKVEGSLNVSELEKIQLKHDLCIKKTPVKKVTAKKVLLKVNKSNMIPGKLQTPTVESATLLNRDSDLLSSRTTSTISVEKKPNDKKIVLLKSNMHHRARKLSQYFNDPDTKETDRCNVTSEDEEESVAEAANTGILQHLL